MRFFKIKWAKKIAVFDQKTSLRRGGTKISARGGAGGAASAPRVDGGELLHFAVFCCFFQQLYQIPKDLLEIQETQEIQLFTMVWLVKLQWFGRWKYMIWTYAWCCIQSHGC